MVNEPPKASGGLVDRVVAQAPLAQHWVRHARLRIAILDHRDSKRLVAGVFGGGAIIHCDHRRSTRRERG
eukprot:5843738-Alexandrium_andersonii.AAC.1